jgi:hypothetical protein
MPLPCLYLLGWLLAAEPCPPPANSFLCLPGDCPAAAVRVPYQPQEGDIILFQTRNLLYRIVFTLLRAGPPTHVGMVVRRPDGELGLLEAPQRRDFVTISPLPERLQTYDGKVWVRPIGTPLSEEESTRLTAFAVSQLGKPFNPSGALIPPFTRPYRGPLQRALGRPPRLDPPSWFCSQLVVAAGIVMGRLDPHRVCPLGTDPGDLASDRRFNIRRCWHPPLRWTCRPHAHESVAGQCAPASDNGD